MIVLACDFGLPYTGQMRARLLSEAPGVEVVELFTDLPAWDVEAAAHLLAAYAPDFPAGSVFCGVVDPGVGSARDPLIVEAEGRRFVGPDNGLFSAVIRKASDPRAWRIDWRPEHLSASFHGRDLFAPVAARLWRGEDEGPGALGPALDRDVGRPRLAGGGPARHLHRWLRQRHDRPGGATAGARDAAQSRGAEP